MKFFSHSSGAVTVTLTVMKSSSGLRLLPLLGEKIQHFLNGEELEFDLEFVDFTLCTKIQEMVLQAEFQIPRGWVSTYKRIAEHIGIINGARVVGNSLARNPFPIIIPCHRAIKSNGELGGYQGGIKMTLDNFNITTDIVDINPDFLCIFLRYLNTVLINIYTNCNLGIQ